MVQSLIPLVVRHTHRLPVPAGPRGEGAAAARQFDVALMSVGFKLSSDLLARLSCCPEPQVRELAGETLATVRELVGDHVRHNSYFVDFPRNVPDTVEFWLDCLAEALADKPRREATLIRLWNGAVDLLQLPRYGRYQHSFEQLTAAHQEFIAGAGDRVTVLHLGGEPEQEVTALYLALAGSSTPLGEEALRDLAVLAGPCAEGPQPAAIPVRENRAVVNLARLKAGSGLLLDTVTDVLRLACALSGGDVTLATPTRFRTMSRPARRALLAGLDALVSDRPGKLADVLTRREAFKRLGERLHPHEYPQWPHAASVFAAARGELTVRTAESRVEELLAAGDVLAATELLAATPGRLLRALDRLLRGCRTEEERAAVVAAVERAAPEASGRLLLSLREHLQNRYPGGEAQRLFVNRHARAKVLADTRPPLPTAERLRLMAVLDAETARRLPAGPRRLLVDPDLLDVALPLSGKATAAGLGVLPRGSLTPVRGELLRFFVYWKQRGARADFDLSALMLNADFDDPTWLSYTELSSVAGEHSGDITEAPDGASEFIDLKLSAVPGSFIVPQVNVYAGENFEQVEESLFGWMLRETEQLGLPFEARTVRMKSALRGPGRVALPLAFEQWGDGVWSARWLQLHLRGNPDANRVENNRATVADLLRAAVGRQYLTVRHLVDLMAGQGASVTLWDGERLPAEPVCFLGLDRPDGLHPDSQVITPENLRELIPA
ncbi:TerD family protein [Streptomyces sp. TLI_171]|uniref:TerD family protein n=1 Tax=Streptomyces sp. TLI_171 TaxID=1938859 RepID=UPI000C185224|nr:TerD family protein [Streptomyces sp. TLI_171]RKE23130.1 hypothetical protein BX266_6587 [Streptomyces sp. TLI_171]